MDVKAHYERLIAENNDPFRDPPLLQAYMNQWDGQAFLDSMHLNREKRVLEMGVGTGRLAAKVAPLCRKLTGIDLSPATIERARENLAGHPNIELICADFLRHAFDERFDVIYSSLTMMHFEDKQQVISKVDSLLAEDGVFCLSIDKNQSAFLDMGEWKLRVYPDQPERVIACVQRSHMRPVHVYETERAWVIVCAKQR